MLRSLLVSVAAAAAVYAIQAEAQSSITTGQFVARADALRDQGFAALLSPEYQTLKAEAHDAKEALKADNARRLAHRQQPIACVPDGETIGIEDMLDALNALPPSIKRMPLQIGYARVVAQRFPCR